MKSKPSFLPVFLTLSILLFSFSNPAKANHPLSSVPACAGSSIKCQLSTVLKTDTGGGQVVRLDLVQGCIANYNTVMQAHGFSNPGGQPVNINITTTALSPFRQYMATPRLIN